MENVNYLSSVTYDFRQKEAMESAKRTYEILNSELHDELPALYDSRVLFLVTNMQTIFAAEEIFHNETSKVKRKHFVITHSTPDCLFFCCLQVYSELEGIIDKLAKEVQKGTMPRKILPKPQPLSINTTSPPASSPMSNSM